MLAALDGAEAARATTRALLSRHLGIVRDGDGLGLAARGLAALERDLARPSRARAAADFTAIRAAAEARNMVLVARLITAAAGARAESRGAHFRRDCPTPRPEWRHHQEMTLAGLAETDGARRVSGRSPL